MPQQYRKFSTYLKERFGVRVHKISLDAGFSCPNRDGKVSENGCIYCDNRAFSFQSRLGNSESLAKQIEEGMERILKGLEIMFGVKTRLVFERASSFVLNDPQLTGFFLPVFRRILGADNVRIIEPLTIGEDFSAYSHRIPALFFFLGVGQGEKSAALHTPDLNPDEKTLMIGPVLFASAALSYLQNYPAKGGSKNPLD